MQREKDKFGETYLWSLIKDNSKESPSSCFQAQMATISTGILVFGGGANGILKQQKFYDFHKSNIFLTIGEWRNLELTGDVLPLAASAITSTPGDLVYGFGGATNSNNNTIISGDLYKIDVKLNSFEIIKVDGFAPKPRIGASLTYHDNGVILFGGLLADDVLSNEIWRFDLNSNSWSRFNVESKIFARVSHTAVIYDSKLVVYGGLVREFGHNNPKSGSLYPKDDIAVFDFSRKQWHFVFIPGTSRPPGRYHHSAVVLKDEMYVFGGARCRSPKTMDIVFDDEFYTINLLNFQFRSTKNANLPKPRAGNLELI
jgi:N-acetylneuraminic acid mutarotase